MGGCNSNGEGDIGNGNRGSVTIAFGSRMCWRKLRGGHDSGSVEGRRSQHSPRMASVQRRPESVFPCGGWRATSPNQTRGRQHWVQHMNDSRDRRTGLRCAPIGRWCRGLPLPTQGRSNAKGFLKIVCVKFDGRG